MFIGKLHVNNVFQAPEENHHDIQQILGAVKQKFTFIGSQEGCRESTRRFRVQFPVIAGVESTCESQVLLLT